MSTVLETGIVTVGSQDTQQLGKPPPSHTGDLCFSKGKLNEECVLFKLYSLSAKPDVFQSFYPNRINLNHILQRKRGNQEPECSSGSIFLL